MIFLIIPSIIVQIFSVRWHKQTDETNIFCLMSHMFQLQPYERYWRLGVSLAKAKESNELESCLERHMETNKLHLFSSYLGSAPQIIIQLYILIQTDDWSWVVLCSAVFNGLSIFFSIGSQYFCYRQINNYELPLLPCQFFLVMVYKTAFVCSRVLAIVCLAFLLGPYGFVVLGIHVLIMFFLILFEKKDKSCLKTTKLFDKFVLSLIYLFVFYDVKEGSLRWRMAIFYTIIGTENFLFAVVWFVYHSQTALSTTLITLIFTNFLLGMYQVLEIKLTQNHGFYIFRSNDHADVLPLFASKGTISFYHKKNFNYTPDASYSNA